ncbi:MAG: hemolysin family protein [Chloroflexi bacterium]|nr:hemolysin family protein [Chloroflexota bacterium]
MNPELALLVVQVGVMAVLLAANGFFVSVEFAYVTVPHARIDQLASKGSATAALVQRLLADTDRVLAASQIGVTIASLGLGWVGENVAAEVIRLLFSLAPDSPIANGVAPGIGLAIAFVAITSAHIVLGEQTPKIVAMRSPDRFALFTARAVALFDVLLRPIIALLDDATGRVVRLLGVKPLGAHQTVYSVEELKQLIAETEQSGALEPREKEMLHNVIEFDDKLVGEVMTPRPDMIAVEEDTTIADFVQTYSAASHTRFPVYSNGVDNITGFLSIKDVLRAISSQGAAALDQTARELARPAYFVPESKTIGRLFAEMQARNTQLAVVIDEFGGTSGMVTLEALIERIVGRLSDELGDEEPQVETIDERTTQIDAQLRVEEVNEQLGMHVPESENYQTIAGYILYALRRIPKEGEQMRVDNVRLTITEMKGPKIEKVLITRLV